MAKNSHASPLLTLFLQVRKNLPDYGIALALALLAVPLGFLSGLPYALAALLLAALAFFTVNRLLRQKAAAEFQKECSDEQLLQSQKLASIGELSAGIAHEINNPLAIIRQEAEWLLNLYKKDSPLDVAETKICLTEIIHQVDRTREIIHNLLNFARKSQPVVQSVQLNRLIEDMTLLVEKTSPKDHINLVKHLQPDLPPIKSDAPMLRQVILNLLNNAVQATGPDGVITVISQATADNHVMIQVNDNGHGIPTEHISQIFDPFFTTKPQGQGTGLGLSICHGIIERLGGKIIATSEEGRGSSFIVLLPQVLDQKRI
jgi:two-component system, NtrC family, sensor kinase